MTRLGKTIVDSVLNCARCGEDHEDLRFKQFVRPIEDTDGTVWAWWATCPNTEDPIVMRKVEEEEANG